MRNPITKSSSLVARVAARRGFQPVHAREIRRAARASLAEIGRELNVSAMTVQRWETGRSTPEPDSLDRYLELLERIENVT